MKKYWEQRKVYLYGVLVLFPERLGGKEMSELKKFAERELTEKVKLELRLDLINYLTNYEHDRLTTGKSVKPEQFASQQQRLVLAVRKHFDEYGYQSIIKPSDLWPDAKSNDLLKATFWELIFTEQLRTGNVEIINMGEADKDEPLPFAEIEIRIGTLFQQAIEPPRLKKAPLAKQRAWVRMPEKHVFVELGNGAKYQISKQKKGLRTDLAPNSLIKHILDHPAEVVTLADAKKIYGCEDTRNLGEVIRQCGFDEDEKALFFEVCTEDKVKLRQDVYLNTDEIALLEK